MRAALLVGADAIMDLSTSGDLNHIREELLAQCPVPFGTVPIYEVIVDRNVEDIRHNMILEVVEKQASLSTFVKKFLNKEGEITDTVGYHKAVYAARNADTIAQHFYEQGKADAVKDVLAKSNNISAEPKPNAGGDVFIGGLKVRAVNGVDSSKLKFKTKNKNN